MKGDCLERMKEIPDKSVDMVLTDPPYGTTACRWDSVIPFDKMWVELKRIVKNEKSAIVLFGSEPFSSALRMSNIKEFKYDWIWNKRAVTGFANAKKQPLRSHEIISVFAQGVSVYNPQGLVRVNKNRKNSESVGGDSLRVSVNESKNKGSLRTGGKEYIQEFTGYPKCLVEFSRDGSKVHPTQKPVALLEYLIKTYTIENETVLDFTMGSGSTGVACKNLNRNFIGIERDEKYFEIAKERIEKA